MTHKELVERGYKWLIGAGKCKFALREMWCCPTGETPDVIGFDYHTSILIECKTSKSDFRADAKKRFRKYPVLGLGLLRYYMTVPGLLDKDKLPESWGLLEVHPRMIKIVKNSYSGWSSLEKEIIAGRERYLMVSALNRFRLQLGEDFKMIHDINWNPAPDWKIESDIKKAKQWWGSI